MRDVTLDVEKKEGETFGREIGGLGFSAGVGRRDIPNMVPLIAIE